MVGGDVTGYCQMELSKQEEIIYNKFPSDFKTFDYDKDENF